MRIVKQCKCCGKLFVTTRMSTLYCSRACNRRIVHEKERDRELSTKNALLDQEEPNPDFNTSNSLKLLKASDLSVMLGVSRATVYRLFEKVYVVKQKYTTANIVIYSDISLFYYHKFFC